MNRIRNSEKPSAQANSSSPRVLEPLGRYLSLLQQACSGVSHCSSKCSVTLEGPHGKQNCSLMSSSRTRSREYHCNTAMLSCTLPFPTSSPQGNKRLHSIGGHKNPCHIQDTCALSLTKENISSSLHCGNPSPREQSIPHSYF